MLRIENEIDFKAREVDMRMGLKIHHGGVKTAKV